MKYFILPFLHYRLILTLGTLKSNFLKILDFIKHGDKRRPMEKSKKVQGIKTIYHFRELQKVGWGLLECYMVQTISYMVTIWKRD